MCRNRHTIALLALVTALLSLAPFRVSAGDAAHCDLCGAPLTGEFYLATDKVTGEKKHLCEKCIKITDICFACGLPVPQNPTRLPDGRVLCERDAKLAVLDDDEARHICRQTVDDLNHVLSRFASFPVTNVNVDVVDRVTLTALFKVPGNDFECPNILGYTLSQTNGGTHHQISLMSALTARQLRAVCAHEISHAWVFENVPAARRKTLGQDAHEGFCELVAYLLMNSDQDQDGVKAILRNTYTRGQIDCFIAGNEHYGFSEVMDWMKSGLDPLLDKNDPGKLRNISVPVTPSVLQETLAFANVPASRAPTTLVLMGLSGTRQRPFALINNRTFEPGESARVSVDGTNLAIRCEAIQSDTVKVRILHSGEERELKLRDDE